MSDKIIEIRRARNHTNLPDNLYEEAKMRIGSAWSKTGEVLNGLTIAEIESYMPYILSIPKDATEFWIKVKEYFINKRIDVPAQGLKLNIGLDESGRPLHVKDYVDYKFIMVNPYVSKSDKETRQHQRFYINDLQKEKAKKVEATQLRMEAMKECIKVQGGKSEVINQIVKVFGDNPDRMDKDDKLIFLEMKATESPEIFLQIVRNKDLEMVAFLKDALNAEAIRKVGNTYFFGDEELGDSEEDAIKYLKTKSNSGTLQTIKARIKSFA